MTTDAHRGALAAVERVLNRGGDADDVLRAVVAALRERLPHLERVWIEFVEGSERVVGPAAGAGGADASRTYPVRYQGTDVAVLSVAGDLAAGDDDLLERVAALSAAYCLVGWDTGGQSWEP